jgi:hypothetical protein
MKKEPERPWSADTVALRSGADRDATAEQAERLRHVRLSRSPRTLAPRRIAIGVLTLVFAAGIAILHHDSGDGETAPVAEGKTQSTTSPAPLVRTRRRTSRLDEGQQGRNKAGTRHAPRDPRVPSRSQSPDIAPTATTAAPVVESPPPEPSEPVYPPPVEPSTQSPPIMSTETTSQVEREFGIEH